MRTGSPIRHWYFLWETMALSAWPMPFGHGSSIFKVFFVAKPCKPPDVPNSFPNQEDHCGTNVEHIPDHLEAPTIKALGSLFRLPLSGRNSAALTGRTRIQVILHSMFLNHGCHQHFDYNVHDVHVKNDGWIGLAGMRLLTSLQVKRIKQRYMTWIKAPPPPNHTQPIVWHAGTAPYCTSVSKEGAPTPAWKKHQVDSAWCKISFSQDHGLHWVVPTHDRQTYSYTIRYI